MNADTTLTWVAMITIAKGARMKVNFIKTIPFNPKKTQIDFPSLRCAIEWAKANNTKELNLVKVVIKK